MTWLFKCAVPPPGAEAGSEVVRFRLGRNRTWPATGVGDRVLAIDRSDLDYLWSGRVVSSWAYRYPDKEVALGHLRDFEGLELRRNTPEIWDAPLFGVVAAVRISLRRLYTLRFPVRLPKGDWADLDQERHTDLRASLVDAGVRLR